MNESDQSNSAALLCFVGIIFAKTRRELYRIVQEFDNDTAEISHNTAIEK